MNKRKIKVVKIKDGKHALRLCKRIWIRLSKNPPHTIKQDILEFGYDQHCPLCELYHNRSIASCGGCPLNVRRPEYSGIGCMGNGQPYREWTKHHTPANAKRVVKQLQQCLKQIERD